MGEHTTCRLLAVESILYLHSSTSLSYISMSASPSVSNPSVLGSWSSTRNSSFTEAAAEVKEWNYSILLNKVHVHYRTILFNGFDMLKDVIMYVAI